MGLDINLNTSKVDISEEDGIDVNLYADKLDISEDDADDIIIEITGLKSLNKFIGLEDTPLYYDNGKFFKVENNKVVYTDIEWKDISGDIQEAPEIVDLITELIEETSEHLVDRHINIHNNSEEAHPYIQNIIQENYNTLDEKVDNLETELSEDISNLDTALNAEITNREDADSILGARIDSISENIQAEAITRLENDTILQNNINTLSDSLTAEISTRETADSNLSDSISDLSDDLIQEILDRQAGDNNLDSIKANISDVESITGALADSISALDSTVSANYETLDDKIDSINGALSDSINSLSSVVSSNYETLDDKIDSVNGALSDSITALDSVVSENYNTLDDKIDSINSALSDSISGLDTKYTSITGALSDSITALDNKYDTITNNLSDSITTLDNKYDSITSGLGDEIDNVEGALNTHTSNTSNPHNVTKAQVGLGNVDNTSDLNKPISTATQSALDGKVPNTRTVNNKALSSDITLTYTDVNALPDTTTINDLTTATQQNALNSGINSTLTQQITTNQNNISNLSSTVSSNYTTLDNRITSEVNTLNSSISDEETARINADNGLQSQIDAITSASDVTDIVGTYAELQAYDTTSLPDKSIIKVLQDESRNDETTYYRWVITNGTGAWTLIGEEGPYYTKSEADGRFVTQTTTVNNKALSSNITLTASDVGALPDSTVIGNGTLTIQKNSTTIDTFDANATSNKTINISVPTDTSDLTNNAGFISGITSSDVVNALGYTPENINNKVTSLSSSSTDTQYPSAKLVYDELNNKQETLVSGTNIKTVNNNSLLGNGNITIDSLPSQSGQSGKFLTTNGTTASWSTVSIPTVDQTFDGTSANAQSGVAIEGELANYVKSQNGNITISNNGTEASIVYMYEEEGTPQQAYGITLGDTSSGDGVFLVSADRAEQKGYMAGVVPDGFGIEDVLNNRGALLSVLSNGNLAVNGTEVALTTDIPDISTKQDTLVSGTNIKTINNTSLLGSGNLSVGTVKSVNNTQPDNNGNISLTIPTVNNATLTIQKNGTTINTFTANASSDVTCNITVPTAVTDLSDASDYVTNTGLMTILDDYATEQWTTEQASSLYTSIQGWVNNQGYAVSADLANVATTGDYDDLLNKPTIPQAQIQSDWDQTDSSAVDFIKNKPTIPSGVIVDQVYDGTSTNAQSGVAIAGELTNYLQVSNGNVTFTNSGTTGGVAYADSSTGEMYGTFIGQTQWGDGVMMGAVNPNGYLLGVAPSGINIIKGTTTSATNGIALTVTNNNTFAINGTEVALSTDIPTNISDLTDDTATNPVDKADTLTGLTATVTELNYTDGVTSNIQTQFNTITGKIPSQASTSNQLADKAFVNSSVQTATANFRGNWDTWTLVPTSASSYPADYAGNTTPTVNDYLVVQDASDYTSDTLEGTWRFKYTGTWSTDGKSGWNPEYQVNETPLTSAQLAALNSGITSGDVTLISTALQPNDNISELTDDTATYPINKAESVVDNNSGNLKFWSGTQTEYDDDAVYEINTDVLTINGTPTFNIETGVASEFATNKYFRVRATNGDTIYLKIKATDVQTKQGIFGNDVSIGIYNGYLGYNTQSGSGVFTNVAEITANQYIYFKIYITSSYSGSAYHCNAYYNFDGSSNYNTIIADSSNLFDSLYLGRGYIEGSNHPFNGEIDLSESYLVSNNQTKYFANNIHENDIVYITTDTNRIYKGNILLSDDNSKQNTLVSGTNIKTVNSDSLLGSGNLSVGTVKSVNSTSPDSNGNVSLTIPTVPTNISAFTNDSGYITGITSSDVTTALGYTPYNSTNPSGYITSSALTDYVTTNTDQNITGTKTYVGQKKIGFKQSSSSDKLGFTLYNNSNVEKGYLEYNPSNTVDSVPLMTLGNYATASGGLTHVGFRKYSSISGASGAYNLLAPLISDARTPFNLTTTYTNFYLPLGFTNGTTTVTTAKTGLCDISTLLPDVSNFVTNSSLTTTLSSYATQSWVGQQGYLTSIPSSYLQNTATGYNALTILGTAQTAGDGTNVGYSTSAGQYSNAFGNNAKVTGRWSEVFGGHITVSGDWSVGIGHNNKISGNYTVAIGANLGGSSYETTGNYATCLGCYSNATADSAIQIGYGINSTANSLSIGFYNNSTTHYNWQLLDGTTGLIPDARISSNIARTSQITTPTYDSTNERITW